MPAPELEGLDRAGRHPQLIGQGCAAGPEDEPHGAGAVTLGFLGQHEHGPWAGLEGTPAREGTHGADLQRRVARQQQGLKHQHSRPDRRARCPSRQGQQGQGHHHRPAGRPVQSTSRVGQLRQEPAGQWHQPPADGHRLAAHLQEGPHEQQPAQHGGHHPGPAGPRSAHTTGDGRRQQHEAQSGGGGDGLGPPQPARSGAVQEGPGMLGRDRLPTHTGHMLQRLLTHTRQLRRHREAGRQEGATQQQRGGGKHAQLQRHSTQAGIAPRHPQTVQHHRNREQGQEQPLVPIAQGGQAQEDAGQHTVAGAALRPQGPQQEQQEQGRPEQQGLRGVAGVDLPQHRLAEGEAQPTEQPRPVAPSEVAPQGVARQPVGRDDPQPEQVVGDGPGQCQGEGGPQQVVHPVGHHRGQGVAHGREDAGVLPSQPARRGQPQPGGVHLIHGGGAQQPVPQVQRQGPADHQGHREVAQGQQAPVPKEAGHGRGLTPP